VACTISFGARLAFLLPSLCIIPLAAQTSWTDQGILHVTNSPYAKLHNIPIRAVTITDGFWARRRKTNVETSIPTMRELMERDGRMENFRRLAGKSSAPQKGCVASDTDIYKWTEAVGFTLQSGDVPELRSRTQKMIVLATPRPKPIRKTQKVLLPDVVENRP
jgi:hypothetical protein